MGKSDPGGENHRLNERKKVGVIVGSTIAIISGMTLASCYMLRRRTKLKGRVLMRSCRIHLPFLWRWWWWCLFTSDGSQKKAYTTYSDWLKPVFSILEMTIFLEEKRLVLWSINKTNFIRTILISWHQRKNWWRRKKRRTDRYYRKKSDGY